MKKIKFLGIVAAAAIVGTMAFVACDSGTAQAVPGATVYVRGLNFTVTGDLEYVATRTLDVDVLAANLLVANAFTLHFTTNQALFIATRPAAEHTRLVTEVAVVSGLPPGIHVEGSIPIANDGWGSGNFTLRVVSTSDDTEFDEDGEKEVVVTVTVPGGRTDTFPVIIFND